MRPLYLILAFALLGCAHVSKPVTVAPMHDEGGGGFIPSASRLVTKSLLGQAEPNMGASSPWSAYSLTLTAPSGANAVVMNSGAAVQFSQTANTASVRYNAATTSTDFWGGVRVLTTNGGGFSNAVGQTFDSRAASGVNAVTVNTNGARIDFGAGASDYASSDGTIVTFAGPIAVTGAVQASSASIASGKFLVSGATGKLSFDTTDSSGAPGAVTINKPSGQAAVAAGAAVVTITNNTVTTSSIIYIAVQQSDATCNSVRTIIPAAGSFTVTLNTTCTSATKIGFIVFN